MMSAEIDLAQDRLEYLLRKFPLARTRYDSGDVDFCAAIEELCLDDNTDVSQLKLSDFYTDTRWNIRNTGKSVIKRIKLPVFKKYKHCDKDVKQHVLSRINALESLQVRRAVNGFISSDIDIPVSINNHPKFLNGYFASYVASLADECIDIVDTIDSLQCAIDIDNDFVRAIQVHGFLDNWGRAPVLRVLEPVDTQPEIPESVPLIDGFDDNEINIVSMAPPRMDDLTPVVTSHADVVAKLEVVNTQGGLFGMLQSLGSAPEVEYEDEDADEFEDDANYDEDSFEDDDAEIEPDEADEEDSGFEDTSYDENSFESDDENIIDDDSFETFEYGDTTFDDEDELEEVIEEQLEKVTLTDVLDLGTKQKTVTLFSDDYDEYEVPEDSDYDEEEFEDDEEVIDDGFEESYDEDSFEDDDENIIDEDAEDNDIDSDEEIIDEDEEIINEMPKMTIQTKKSLRIMSKMMIQMKKLSMKMKKSLMKMRKSLMKMKKSLMIMPKTMTMMKRL